MVEASAIEYLHAGGNRASAAAKWDVRTNLLAFGSDQNVALWDPLTDGSQGISALLKGHTDTVTAVCFLQSHSDDNTLLLTGSSDCTIRVWNIEQNAADSRCVGVLAGHSSSINAIASVAGTGVFVTASADSTVIVWKARASDEKPAAQIGFIRLSPSYIPLSVCLHQFPRLDANDSLILAVGGTRTVIQLFAISIEAGNARCELQATLSGHEGWIRSLAATNDVGGDVIIASASQDKYVRLWRIKHDTTQQVNSLQQNGDLLSTVHPLKKKIQLLKAHGQQFAVTFEALLLGHEDWVYSAVWNPGTKTQLLTASADNSLSVWEADETSGIWTSVARLGEISEQKGATSATGSSGGLWNGLWSSDGNSIASLGRTGSWRLWTYDNNQEYWNADIGVSGHVRSVSDLVWDAEGRYLLSTSLDQTTRLHAPWKRRDQSTWHEISRPQIHGYDLNCLATLGQNRFVSGADEKLLRVFEEPRAVGNLLENLSGITTSLLPNMPEAADMPVLGLSNKVVEEEGGHAGELDDAEANAHPPARTALDISIPPPEDLLARHTLWPETEKLYGHGYEISAVASNHDQSIIATACKASSLDHAVIRLYDASHWHEIRPALTAHALTIARLRFSPDDKYLLSVGRDRQWAVFKRTVDAASLYTPAASNLKGHSRMILDAAWAPTTATTIASSDPSSYIFATAGRDKTVKIWQFFSNGRDSDNTSDQPATVSSPKKPTTPSVTLLTTIPHPSTVTAIDFAPVAPSSDTLILASGQESGQISLHTITLSLNSPLTSNADNQFTTTANNTATTNVAQHLCPSKAVTRLAWRPRPNPNPNPTPTSQKDEGKEEEEEEEEGLENTTVLAVGGADSSIRLLRILQ